MSAWSNAGWPSGIFLANPRAAINLIIDAVNSLTACRTASAIPLPHVPALTKKSLIRSTLGTIDQRLRFALSGSIVNYNQRWTTAHAEYFPPWMVTAAGDVPMIDSQLVPARFLLRWVLSRYKLIAQAKKFAIFGYWALASGNTSSSWQSYSSASAYLAELAAWLVVPDASPSGALDGISIYARNIAGSYGLRRATHFRYKLPASIPWVSPARFSVEAITAELQDAGEYDSSILGPVGTLITSPRTDLLSPSAAALIDLGEPCAYPYGEPPELSEEIYRHTSLNGDLVADISEGFAYYDPPEVWQNINIEA